MPQTKIDTLAVQIAQTVIRFRWLMMLLCLLAIGAAGYGAKNLDFATDYRVFFSGENPDLVAFEAFQNTYTKNDNFLFVLQPKDGNAFSPEMAALQEYVTEQSWQIPYSIRVDSVSNFQHTWSQEDDLTVEDLIKNGGEKPQEWLDARRAIALGEPLLLHNLVNGNADTVGVNVVLQYPGESLAEVPTSVAKAREIFASVQAQYPDVHIALTGLSMMNHSFSESGMQDAATLIPAMYGVLLLMTFLTLRSISATVATLSIIMLSTIAAMGVGGWMHVELTPISMSTPTIVLTLAIADSIHILITVRELMRGGMGKREAIVEAMRLKFLAVGITTLTTIVGFMALNFSDAPPFHHLGNMTAAGIFAAWVLSVFFLPALMSLLPMKVKPLPEGEQQTHKYFDALADFVIHYRKGIVIVGGLITVGLSAMVTQNRLDDSWMKYFDESIQFRRDSDFATAHLGGLYPIEFSIPAAEAGGVSDPAFLQTIDAFTQWLRAHEHVTHVYSLSDIMKRLNQNMHGDDESWYRLPDNAELSAQYLLLYELSLPYGLDLNDRVNLDKSATRITATLGDVSTVETRAFIQESMDWLKQNAPAHMQVKPTGATVMFSFIAERNILSMIRGNAIAIALIAIVMMLTLRSASMGLMSMLPNAIPVLVTFGIWSMLVGIVGLAAATITATSLGIVVDDTVHFLTKYLRGRREHLLDAAGAVRYAFRHVGKAISVNTLILASGFFVLFFSSFKINQEMGLLTGLAVIVALFFDFLILPAMLVMFGKKNKGA